MDPVQTGGGDGGDEPRQGSATRRHRVVRCGQCRMIYPYLRRRCTSCGSAERVFALASFQEIERARLQQGVARRELRVPRSVAERPVAKLPLLERLAAWQRTWAARWTARWAGR